VALEVAAEVTLGVDTAPVELSWPWVETSERIAVLVVADEFSDARKEAIDAMLILLEQRLGLSPADGLALISVIGDLRIGQACGGMNLTLRLELPRLPGLAIV
jgi:acetamidase/formamidase